MALGVGAASLLCLEGGRGFEGGGLTWHQGRQQASRAA